ncbi:rhomboid family intramembrane serine protease [Chitinophaga sp. Cy-1792]|uniref:rhomboid family intramembrane serine protease n=1 Tax=Chitinophaga sp. Cy-1792 TaxID=2608339 RepID=UPI0014202B28|nr:rhomboid family intramembrane serine protease [Chitinophaga sp. Cy-1792]NIG52303.1 rhomboid family intramembrane serine protease [Chitinophaga sp. Cy-1792]
MHTLEKTKMSGLSLGAGKNMVTQLLVINLTVFIFLLFTKVIYQMENVGVPQFYTDIMSYLRVPSDPGLALRRPWTVLSAIFTHIEVLPVFTNMVWLWCFGSMLQHLAGYLRILPLYIFGGVVGNIFYVLGMQFIPGFQAIAGGAGAMGAAGSVMAIAIGATIIAPKYRIFPLLAGGGIPLWIITAIYLVLNIGSHFTSTGGVVFLPMLVGGGLAGWVYMSQWKKGNDLGGGFNRVSFKLSHMFHPAAEQKLPTELQEHAAATDDAEPPYKRVGKVPEQRLNEILDKINANGITSLTPEEKETLVRASNPEN